MMADLASALLESACALSAALIMVLGLRLPARRLGGAGAAYGLWLLVPAVVAATLLPNLQVRPATIALTLHTVAAAALPDLLPAPARAPALELLVLAWGGGALLMAAWCGLAHRRFVRSLGLLTQRDGIFFSASAQGGPASLGLWRPRVVVPADFHARYTGVEQMLIIRHEQVHAERGDAIANLVQVALQCLFWFHPLVHWAALRFRTDQELACDAVVLRRHRGRARSYAQALLKSHTFSIAAPATVACHWQSSHPKHPLKERIMSLQQGQFGKIRRLAGRLAVLSLVLGAAGAGMLARADVAIPAVTYDVAISMSLDGAQSSPRVLVRGGEAFAIANEQEGMRWRTEFIIAKIAATDTVRVSGKIERAGEIFSRPTLVGRLGEPIAIKVTDAAGHDFALSMVVREAPARAAQQ
jgi:beta-lactamase regulating signal transducer with metallopeptidase domain